MPELPEAEYARSLLSSSLSGRVLKEVWVDLDPIVMHGNSAQAIEKHCLGNRVLGAHRIGKYIWLEFERGPNLMIHLGMTGTIRVPGRMGMDYQGQRLGNYSENADWPPRFCKWRVRGDEGVEVVYTNARRFGRMRLFDSVESDSVLSKLGFDPILSWPSFESFFSLLQKRSGNIKGLLLNQRFCAGLGNWIVDEVLYQAQISPHRRASDLNKTESKKLHSAIRGVCSDAVKVDADKARFPKHWLFHRRWGRPDGAHTHDGYDIRIETIAGRSSAWVPTMQV